MFVTGNDLLDPGSALGRRSATGARFGMRTAPEGTLAGLMMHPLNLMAGAMIFSGFPNFVTPGTPALQATAAIAICLLSLQVMLHPIWTLAGDRIARTVAGSTAKKI